VGKRGNKANNEEGVGESLDDKVPRLGSGRRNSTKYSMAWVNDRRTRRHYSKQGKKIKTIVSQRTAWPEIDDMSPVS